MSVYVAGTMGSDSISVLPVKTGTTVISFAGNDVLDGSKATSELNLLGGSGNDSYHINMWDETVIYDTGGTNDTLYLHLTKAELGTIISKGGFHGVLEGKHYVLSLDGNTLLTIANYSGQGAIENVVSSDGVAMSFSAFVEAVGGGALRQLTTADLGADHSNYDNYLYYIDHVFPFYSSLEDTYAKYATPVWFDSESYMSSKIAEMNGTMSYSQLEAAFRDSGFIGRDGLYVHYEQYGQWEDVSPLALFDSNYYFRSKAAAVNNIDISRVTDVQIQAMHDAIHAAGMNAWTHYERYGTQEGIDASAQFDTSAYMKAKLAQVQQSDPSYTEAQLYQAFRDGGLSAVAHYQAYGKDEGITLAGVSTTDAGIPVEVDA